MPKEEGGVVERALRSGSAEDTFGGAGGGGGWGGPGGGAGGGGGSTRAALASPEVGGSRCLDGRGGCTGAAGFVCECKVGVSDSSLLLSLLSRFTILGKL